MSAAGKKKIRVVLIKSPFGTGKRHIACVRGLGLRRMNDSRELVDSPEVRGMIRQVHYMVKVDEV
jgi:large subunit ribosomal protein L30